MQRLVLLVLLLIGAPAGLAAVTCSEALVDIGMTRYDVISLCGEPDWKDGWSGVQVFGALGPLEQQDPAFIEYWYYNLGPDRLIRLFTFTNLHLVRIDHLGYGWVPTRRRQCKPDMFLAGMSKYEVWFSCGEPAWAESWNSGQVRRPAPGLEAFRQIHHDVWIYDFGTRRFQRILHFENGFLTRTETGERGRQ